MADIQVANTDSDLSGNTVVTEENAYTITGLHTYSRSTNAPFACISGSAVVTYLNADKLDGQEGAYYLAATNATGTLAVNRGGTGAATFTDGGVLLGSGTSAITATAVLGDGVILIGDASGDPTTLDVGSSSGITILGTVVTGVWNGSAVTVPHGGTGVISFTAGGVLLGGGTGPITATAVLGDGVILIGDASGDPTTLDVGSSSGITILGTVATGVWQGTAVADTYVANDLTISGGTVNNSVIGGSTAAAATVTTLNTTAAVVHNDAGADVDFRVEGDTVSHLIFADASTDRVGIGTSVPDSRLHVFNASAGTVVPHSTADEFIIENSAGAGMSIITPDANDGRIAWSSPSTTADIGCRVMFNYDADLMTIGQIAGGAAVYLKGANTGIGVADPDTLLHIEKSQAAATVLKIENPNASTAGEVQIAFRTDGNSLFLQGFGTGFTTSNYKVQAGGALTATLAGGLSLAATNAAGDIRFYAGGVTEVARIDDAGNVGINQTTPTHKLHVVGDIKLQSSQVHLTDGYGLLWGDNGINGNASSDSLRFDTAGGARLTIDNLGLVTLGNNLEVVGSSVFNDAGADKDFRVESLNKEVFNINGAGDNIGIGFLQTDTGGALLTIENSSNKSCLDVHQTTAGEACVRIDGGSTNTVSNLKCRDSANATLFEVLNNGNVSIPGALSKGSGSFKISHPLPAKTDTHHLIHSFVESPDTLLIYRGSVALVAGQATIDLDNASGMTIGTWVLLCRDAQCFTSNETGWFHVRGSVSGSTLTIDCEEATCTDTVSWMVVANRKDQHIIEADWTDEDGYPVVEPEKPEELEP